MNASLSEKLRAVKWGEFRLTDIFVVKNTSNLLASDIIAGSGETPYLCASSENNAVSSYIKYDKEHLEKGNCIFIGGKTFVVTYQSKDFYSNDSHNLALYLKKGTPSKAAFLYMASCVYKSLHRKYSWGNSISKAKIQEDIITLPVSNGKIDFAFMDSFIAELEAERVAELEAERVAELSAYLTVSGLDNYELSSDEVQALQNYSSLTWKLFNLECLFGKSTRGKRLKGDDRISGTLPFVTAGEASEGISAYISNDVEIFEKNTTTIDMFGSAKYRNYKYGADDHIAVVHTETVPMKAAIFLTSAIHKAAHTGKFDYGHNFYAKDADALDIMLPAKDGKPDYTTMETLISAVQKLVIKEVVLYANQKIKTTKAVTKRY
ncbi:restriction endonuclease subunit S [Gemmiger formicilis]|uniref:restriction endonuclease subunit S n=1 Tax=Gemmiger formicilis TaxID=745368 RepID=UPI00307C04E6